MKTILRTAIVAALVAGSPLTQVAHAASPLNAYCGSWPAVAMTPYDLNIQRDDYKMTHERVYHNVGRTGSILLYGPVPTDWQPLEYATFRLYFKDPDGVGTGAAVRAELRFVDNAGGIHSVVTLSSTTPEGFRSHGGGVASIATTLPGRAFERNDGFYSVRVYVQRDDIELLPAALSYEFCGVIG